MINLLQSPIQGSEPGPLTLSPRPCDDYFNPALLAPFSQLVYSYLHLNPFSIQSLAMSLKCHQYEFQSNEKWGGPQKGETRVH